TTAFSLRHRYLDDNPTGTASDDTPVTVVVTDSAGGTTTITTTITIDNAPPEVDRPLLTSDAISVPGAPVTMSQNYRDAGADMHTAQVAWGDTTLDRLGPVAGGRFSSTHVYRTAGHYQATTTVTDDDLGTTTTALPITILTPRTAAQAAATRLVATHPNDT